MRLFEILNAEGEVTATLATDADYMATHYPPSSYRDAGEYQPPAPPPAEDVPTVVLPKLVITNIASSSPITVTSNEDVTCTAGATLVITAELRDADGHVLPLSDKFRLPIQSGGGREKVFMAVMTNGIVTINAPMRESGVWSVTQDMINEHLPEASHMEFAGCSVFVVEL